MTYRDYSTDNPIRTIYALRRPGKAEAQSLVDPSKTRDLWLQFSRLKTEKDMVAFARKFGLLDSESYFQTAVVPLRKNARWSDDFEESDKIARRIWARENGLSDLSDEQLNRSYKIEWFRDLTVSGEPVALWMAHLSELQPLVRLYNAISNYDLEFLKRKFTWQPDGRSSDGYFALQYICNDDEFLVTKSYFDERDSSVGKRKEELEKSSGKKMVMGEFEHTMLVSFTDFLLIKIDPVISKTFKEKGDMFTPAKLFLSSRVNRHLANNLQTQLVSTSDLSETRLRIVPNNLITAIWYQFAQAIAVGQSVAVCEECHEFYAKLNRRGSKQRFCSNACRSKNNRLLRDREAA